MGPPPPLTFTRGTRVVVGLVGIVWVFLSGTWFLRQPSLKTSPEWARTLDGVAALRTKPSWPVPPKWFDAPAQRAALQTLVEVMNDEVRRRGYMCLPAINVGSTAQVVAFDDGAFMINPLLQPNGNDRVMVRHTTAFGDPIHTLLFRSVNVTFVGPLLVERTQTLVGKRAECLQSAVLQFH